MLLERHCTFTNKKHRFSLLCSFKLSLPTIYDKIAETAVLLLLNFLQCIKYAVEVKEVQRNYQY